MTHKVITLEFVVPTVLAIALGIVLAVKAHAGDSLLRGVVGALGYEGAEKWRVIT